MDVNLDIQCCDIPEGSMTTMAVMTDTGATSMDTSMSGMRSMVRTSMSSSMTMGSNPGSSPTAISTSGSSPASTKSTPSSTVSVGNTTTKLPSQQEFKTGHWQGFES